jgi:hypothetical protein
METQRQEQKILNGIWVNTIEVLKASKYSKAIELRYLEILLRKVVDNWKAK